MIQNTRFSTREMIAGLLLAATLGSASAATTTVSLNWSEFTGAANLVNDPYGVVSASNWHNLGTVTNGTDMVADGGAASTLDFTITAPGGYGTFFNAALANTPMRAGVESFSSSNGPTLTLSDLSGTFVSYDIIVYVSGFNGASNTGSVTDGSATKYFQVPNPYNGALVESTDTNLGDGADLGTYVRFDGLTADSTTISLRQAAGGGVALGGIQITGTAVPEPGAVSLLGLGLLAGCARRKRG